MRPPRISLRLLLLFVAILALLLGTWLTWQRRAYYQRRAAYWASREQNALKWATALEADPDEGWRRWASVERESADRYRRIRLRYESASAHPWIRLDPDPLEYRGRIHPEIGFVPEGLEGE